MLHPDATTIRLVHRHMIDEEMQRHQQKRDRDDRRPRKPRRRPTFAIRQATARALRTVAGWIEPRPPVEGTAPPAKPAA